MMFNQKREITFLEIKDAMKFDDEACTKNIKSFMIKQKVLERKGEGGIGGLFSNSDVFFVNETFVSQIKKITLPLPQIEEVYKKGILNYCIKKI